MNFIRRSTFAAAIATAFALSLPSLRAQAQSSAPPALPDLTNAASAPAPAASATGPRVQRPRSAAETGARAAAPGDLKPERPVSPQISIPFGKKPPPPTKAEENVVRRGNPAATGGVDDAAARCESQDDDQLRAACRAKLAREAKGKLPN